MITYNLNIYEGALDKYPEMHFESEKPFPAFSVGDWIDPMGWSDKMSVANRRLKIMEIQHRIAIYGTDADCFETSIVVELEPVKVK